MKFYEDVILVLNAVHLVHFSNIFDECSLTGVVNNLIIKSSWKAHVILMLLWCRNCNKGHFKLWKTLGKVELIGKILNNLGQKDGP